MGSQGTAIIDFGIAPGSNKATVTVSDAAMLSTSVAESWKMANSTSDHNAIEHMIVPIQLVCEMNPSGGSFIIHAISDFKLTGTFMVNWVWV